MILDFSQEFEKKLSLNIWYNEPPFKTHKNYFSIPKIKIMQ